MTQTDASVQPFVMTLGTPDGMIELLRRFCDSESSRYALAEPFVQGGRLYACNGYVAVSIPCDAPDTVVEGRLPLMSNVMDYETKTTIEWNPSIVECNECGGQGSIELIVCGECHGDGDCPACNGSGAEMCYHCEHEHDCDECDGGGCCPTCNGDGKTEAYKSKCDACKDLLVDVSGCTVRISTARLIGSLKDVRYAIKSQSRGFKSIVFDAADGVRGVAMSQSS